MLMLNQLIGFGSGSGGGVGSTPNAIDFGDISDAGIVAFAATNVVTITGIDTTITLRLTLTTAMTAGHFVSAIRDGVFVSTTSSGTIVDVTVTNNQTLQYYFTNQTNFTIWSGTATLTNLSDGAATLDTFAFDLQDTGNGGGEVSFL